MTLKLWQILVSECLFYFRYSKFHNHVFYLLNQKLWVLLINFDSPVPNYYCSNFLNINFDLQFGLFIIIWDVYQ